MGNLFAELKRRHIYRVAAAYAVVAWVLIQLVNNVAPALRLPEWAPTLVIVLLLVGFPITLLIAWMRELAPADGGAARAVTSKLDWVLIGALVAVLAVVSYQQLAPTTGAKPAQQAAVATAASPTSPAQPGGISIAVLPFVNLSSDKEQEFFSDGMTEEITSALAKVPSLRVVARTSAYQFRDQNRDIQSIGQRLHATHFIEGSVRKAGDRVRITAQLIKADDGTHVWAENYYRELTDVFAIQEEIASAVAGALRMPLGLKPGEQLVSNRAIDADDYEQFLRGKTSILRGRTAFAEQLAILEPVLFRRIPVTRRRGHNWQGPTDLVRRPRAQPHPKRRSAIAQLTSRNRLRQHAVPSSWIPILWKDRSFMKNDSMVHGIAFNAQVLAVDYFSNVNETQEWRDSVLRHVSDPWTYITDYGARIVNVSFGYDSGDSISNPPPVSEVYVLASRAQAVVNGALLVTSAGNGGGPNPSLSNQHIIADLISLNALTSGPGAFIIAGAVNANYQLSSFSNRAGNAMDHYMVAPGEDLVVLWTGGLAEASGTSLSAPLISGAAALIFEHWPNLTGRQVADILFQSATDLGVVGVDAVYGHGLLNVEAALQPIGTTSVAVATGTAPAVYATGMVLSPAFGDAPAFRAALSEVTILDGFGRNFIADASRSVYSRPNVPDLFGMIEQKFRWHGASYQLGHDAQFSYTVRENPTDPVNAVRTLNGAEDIHSHETVFRFSGATERMSWSAGTGLSLRDALSPRMADDPFTAASLTGAFFPMIGVGRGRFATARVALGSETGLTFGIAEEQVRDTYAGAPFAPDTWTHAAALKLDQEAGRTRLDFELGGLLEDSGVFGTLAAGGLSLSEHAATVWVSATSQTALNERWALRASLTIAAAGVQHPSSSLVSSLGPVYATSFSLGVAGKDLLARGDALALVIGQPLRVEQAPVTLMTGVARDWTTGAVILTPAQSSLTPSGREIDLETAYRFALADWNIATSIAYSIDANHVLGQNAVTGVLWLSRKF